MFLLKRGIRRIVLGVSRGVEMRVLLGGWMAVLVPGLFCRTRIVCILRLTLTIVCCKSCPYALFFQHVFISVRILHD